jgi:signal transduction histidine kinase
MKEGIGLAGIKERIEEVGGKTEFFNGVEGFVVNAQVPLNSKTSINE